MDFKTICTPIAETKILISKIMDIASTSQKLMLGRVELLDDGNLLDYGITKGSVLHVTDLREELIAFVFNTGHEILVRAAPSLRMHILLMRISKLFGLRACDYCFLFSGSQIKRDSRLGNYLHSWPLYFAADPSSIARRHKKWKTFSRT